MMFLQVPAMLTDSSCAFPSDMLPAIFCSSIYQAGNRAARFQEMIFPTSCFFHTGDYTCRQSPQIRCFEQAISPQTIPQPLLFVLPAVKRAGKIWASFV